MVASPASTAKLDGMLLNLSAHLLAVVLIAGGLVVLPLPIPLGAIMILLGLGLMISVNPRVKARVRKVRHGHPKLEAVIERVRPYLPAFLKRVLEESAPR